MLQIVFLLLKLCLATAILLTCLNSVLLQGAGRLLKGNKSLEMRAFLYISFCCLKFRGCKDGRGTGKCLF